MAPGEDATSAGERLDAVKSRIARAVAKAGRPENAVTLIAVSKTQGPDAIRPLIEAGQRAFGENRVQEAAAKWPPFREALPDIRLHLIGRLQSNKADDAVALFNVIHSVDRPSIIDALARAIAKQARAPELFVQVNIGDEPRKGGCPIGNLPDLLVRAQDAGLAITGLMCLPPAGAEPAPYFALLAKLARRHDVAGLSMGMSNDYECAVMIGATHVRIGTALFGARA